LSSDVDQVRKLYEAVGSGDLETVSALLAPDVLWEHNLGVGSPEEGVYSGRDSVIQLLRRILEAWESLQPESHEIKQIGEGTYLVRGELRVKHALSATEVVTPFEQHLELRDGVVVKGRMKTASIAGGGEADPGRAGDSENVALIREFTEAFNRRDVDHMISRLDPEVELHEWPTAPGAGSYRGHEGVRRAFDSWFEVWAWMQIEIVDIVAVEDRVMVTLHQRAKGKGSEVEVEIGSFNVYTVREGKVVRIELYIEREPALAAAGLLANQMSEEAR
jgi:ketosteroid isomerase-like protein